MLNGRGPDFVKYTDNDQINRLLNRVVSQVKVFTESQTERIKTLTDIGRALSAEKSTGRLLEMIVDEARKLSNADGGTLYIMNDEETELRFAIVQNDSLDVRMGGTGGEITWDSVKVWNPDGSPNHSNVSAYAALSGDVVNIPDVYDAEGFNFEGTRKFDSMTGYRSASMLVVPMRNHENDIIGVLQLLNAKDMVTGEVIPFSLESQGMSESLASQAAVALTNNRLINDLENLLESFITSIASAIDEKSPYTGGHVRRVAELTMTIARAINERSEGPYAQVSFDEDQLKELRLAAWLHDVGKVTTPEHVVDKSTKLETVFDRIELVKTRVEVLKRDAEIESLRKSGCGGGLDPEAAREEYLRGRQELEDDLSFLETGNIGGEFMADDKIERLKAIAGRTWNLDGSSHPLLKEDEVDNLSIRRGTLNDEERQIINNHATVTYKMLSRLPFPKKLRNVPGFAAAHHEKMDGTGYPRGLKGDELPLQSRIMALADVFEALTAKDRPYKKGKTLSEAVKILGFMVKDNHIDRDLFDLFIEEKIYEEYAKNELAPEQIDEIVI